MASTVASEEKTRLPKQQGAINGGMEEALLGKDEGGLLNFVLRCGINV